MIIRKVMVFVIVTDTILLALQSHFVFQYL